MEMVNTHSYTAMQFHLILPEGITLDMDYPFDMNSDRFPGVTKRGVFYPNHDYDITNPSPGDYFIKIYNTALETIDGTEGELLCFYYNVASDIKDGYYQILVSGAILGIDSHNGIYPETSVSYVKVGEPSKNALLDLGSYEIPSFVAEYIPETNVVINGECSNLVLSDGYDFNCTNSFVATDATYSRFLSSSWGTLCLPFALESDATIQYYKLVSVSSESMTFEPVSSVDAGEPVVFKNVDTDELVINASNVTVSNGNKEKSLEALGWTMKGTYDAFINDPAACENDIYYIAEDKFWYANMAFAVAAFRGWFETAKNAAGAQRYSIVETEGLTNGVEYVEQEDGSVKVIFDLQGRRMDDAQKGNVNIVNGKTVIVK